MYELLCPLVWVIWHSSALRKAWAWRIALGNLLGTNVCETREPMPSVLLVAVSQWGLRLGPWTFPPCCMHGSPVRLSREGPFFLQRQEAREVPPVFRSCPDEPEPCQWEETWEKQTEPRATLSFTMVGEAQLALSFSEWWFSTALNIRVNWELLETSMAGPCVRPSKSEAGHVAWARVLFFFLWFISFVSIIMDLLWFWCSAVFCLSPMCFTSLLSYSFWSSNYHKWSQ